jgi:hypothetical protein
VGASPHLDLKTKDDFYKYVKSFCGVFRWSLKDAGMDPFRTAPSHFHFLSADPSSPSNGQAESKVSPRVTYSKNKEKNKARENISHKLCLMGYYRFDILYAHARFMPTPQFSDSENNSLATNSVLLRKLNMTLYREKALRSIEACLSNLKLHARIHTRMSMNNYRLLLLLISSW